MELILCPTLNQNEAFPSDPLNYWYALFKWTPKAGPFTNNVQNALWGTKLYTAKGYMNSHLWSNYYERNIWFYRQSSDNVNLNSLKNEQVARTIHQLTMSELFLHALCVPLTNHGQINFQLNHHAEKGKTETSIRSSNREWIHKSNKKIFMFLSFYVFSVRRAQVKTL